MKVLLTGGKGMLGRTIVRVLDGTPAPDGSAFKIVPTDLPDVDMLNPGSLAAALMREQPDAVVHCAAMTAVDACETAREKAFLLNEQGTANVAALCHALGVRLVAISTDYVFDGDFDRPYRETDAATGGRTVYGQSKFAGEERVRALCPNHVILRISWLYGFGGPSFVHAMLKLADGTRASLKVVDDQRGNPTSAVAVARELAAVLGRPELRGTIHATCEGEASWAEFAREIFRLAGRDQTVEPCTTEEFPRPAPRPKNSRLEKAAIRAAGLPPMPDWRAALSEFMKEEFGYGP